LYTLTERDAGGSFTRVIGAVREVLIAPRNPGAVVARIAAPETRIASFTVTEKGYARQPDGALDPGAAERSFYSLLARGLRRRMEQGLPGLTLLSCDNLPANGRELGCLFGQWTAARLPEIADWVARECTFPNAMVDRIVPAATAADLDDLENRIGLR